MVGHENYILSTPTLPFWYGNEAIIINLAGSFSVFEHVGKVDALASCEVSKDQTDKIND